MNTVWVFGDSYSMDYHKDSVEWSKKYIEFKGRQTKSYGLFFAEEINYKYENYAVGGYDNYSIFETICDNSHKFISGDVILIGWAPYTRYRIVGEYGTWVPISGLYTNNYNNLSRQTLNEILVHRDHILFEEEIKKWEKLIKLKMDYSFFYSWCWFIGDERTKHETVLTDTNGIITDEHWSENGHREFSKKILEKYKNWKENL